MKKVLTLLILCICFLLSCNKDSSQTDISLEGLPVKEDVNVSENGAISLEEAIKTDDKEAIAHLLEKDKVDPNQKTEEGEPVLNLAARRGFAFAVEQLLKAGANVNGIDKHGRTALMNLYQEDYYFSETEGITDYKKVRDLLLNAKADVNIADKDGMTVLMGASYVAGAVDDVKKLIEAGANVNATANNGNTALVWACIGMDSVGDDDEKDKNKTVRLLLSAGADQKVKALETAIGSDFAKIAKTILDSRINIEGKTGEKLLMTASSAGLLEMVKTFLSSGVNVNAVDEQGKTALVYALLPCGMTQVCDDKNGVAKVLIKAGADVNLLVFDKTTGKDINDTYAQYKETPLMIASKNGNLEIVKELLAAGAKVDQILPINTERELMPSENQTALEMACQEDNIEVVKTLAEAGANARTVILCACKIGYEDLLKIALRNKPNLNFTTGEGGVSPLIMAAEKGYENIVKALLAAGADANYTNPFDTDYTALKAAKDYPNIVELLKSYGAKE